MESCFLMARVLWPSRRKWKYIILYLTILLSSHEYPLSSSLLCFYSKSYRATVVKDTVSLRPSPPPSSGMGTSRYLWNKGERADWKEVKEGHQRRWPVLGKDGRNQLLTQLSKDKTKLCSHTDQNLYWIYQITDSLEEGGMLRLCSPVRRPPAMCSFWTLEKWLVPLRN